MSLKRFGVIFLMLGVFVFVSTTVNALPIGPDKYYLDIQQDQTLTESLFLYGRQEMESSETLYLYPVTMEKVGEEHERKFYFPNPADTSAAANWIILSKDVVTVAPGETAEITWTITPNMAANCGTNLAAILVADAEIGRIPDAEVQEISVGSQLISQIHLNVLSDTNGECENLSTNFNLLEFDLTQTWPIYTMDSDVGFVTKIENTGNIMGIEPGGYIEIAGFHQEINLLLNEEKYDIYPQTTRRFDNILVDENFPSASNFWSKLLYEIRNIRIGKYSVNLGVSRNVQPALQASLAYWVIPWRIVVTVIAIAVALISGKKINNYINRENK